MNAPVALLPAELLAPNPQGAIPGSTSEAPADGRIASTFAALLQAAHLENSASNEAPVQGEITDTPGQETPAAIPAGETPANALDGLLFLAHVLAVAPSAADAGADAPGTAFTTGAASRRTPAASIAASIEAASDETMDSDESASAGDQLRAIATDAFTQKAATAAIQLAATRDARALQSAINGAAASASGSAAETPGLVVPSIAAPAVQTAAVPVIVSISTPVQAAGWHEETAQRVAGLVTRGTDRAELRLSPAELGPVDLRIEVKGTEATLMIVAAHATTRDALEQAMPMLRELLAQQGLALGEATVSDGKAEDPAAGRHHRSAQDGAGRAQDTRETMTLRVPGSTRLIDTFA